MRSGRQQIKTIENHLSFTVFCLGLVLLTTLA